MYAASMAGCKYVCIYVEMYVCVCVSPGVYCSMFSNYVNNRAHTRTRTQHRSLHCQDILTRSTVKFPISRIQPHYEILSLTKGSFVPARYIRPPILIGLRKDYNVVPALACAHACVPVCVYVHTCASGYVCLYRIYVYGWVCVCVAINMYM